MINTIDKISDIRSSDKQRLVDLRKSKFKRHLTLKLKRAIKRKVSFSDIKVVFKERLEIPKKISETKESPVLDSLIQPEVTFLSQKKAKPQPDFLHPSSQAYGKEIKQGLENLFKTIFKLAILLAKFSFSKTKLFILKARFWTIKFTRFSEKIIWPFLKFSIKTLAHLFVLFGLGLAKAFYSIGKWAYFKIRGIKYIDFSGYKQLFVQKRLAPISLKRNIVGFLVLCLCFTFSIRILDFVQKGTEAKADVLASTNIAYQYLQSAQNSFSDKDYHLAAYKFGIAGQSFKQAQKDIEQIGKTITQILKLFPVSKISLNEVLLEAGANLSLAGEHLSKALEPLTCTGLIFKNLGLKKDTLDCPFPFTQGLTVTYRNLETSLEKIIKAEKYLSKIDIKNSLPKELADQILGIQEKLPKLKQTISSLIGYSDSVLTLLGHYEPKRYLVLFQNSRELRATGGFIGSFGLLDIDQGEIKKFYIDPEGPYRLDGQLKEKIEAPKPISLLTGSRWYLRDANWFFDFPSSAKKVIWFYERSGGPSVDGVIALSANLIPKLLEITGPIDLPKYNLTITSENFFEKTQYQVEVAYNKEENKPKQFIADLFPKLLEKLTNLEQEKKAKLKDIILEALDQKDILIYLGEEKLQKLISDLDFSGEIKQTQGDFLAVVCSNIGGGKTDHIIKQEIYHRAEIKQDGTVEVILDITRFHQGNPNDIWEKIKNVSYIRVYVPKGSKLISASGFDSWYFNAIPQASQVQIDPDLAKIYNSRTIDQASNTEIFEEQGKTVFANWLGVEVGQKKTAQLKYQLPFKLNHDLFTYSLFVQKQPGIVSDFTSSLFYYPGLSLVWHYSTDNLVQLRSGSVDYEANLSKDRMYAVVLTK